MEDLDEALSQLQARGVQVVREITDTPVCRFAIIADPDGNRILIHKRKG
jgi:predicted enzyme related to lactoylglutathione lyase